MTKLISTVSEWRELRKSFCDETIGFVPTMGNLHEGHMSLIKRSVAENDVTVLSCFVNVTQFNSTEDFDHYPRTIEADLELCQAAGVDYFFAPSYEVMYPDDYHYQVSENVMSCVMEGAHRPGHFNGMLTVVLKLLLLMKSSRAYFGEKDYQQLQLVQGMVEAFFIDTEIVPCEIIRNEFCLALSSRNRRLTEEQLALSQFFPKYLRSNRSCETIVSALEAKGFEVEYVEERDGRRFGAVRLGGIRLIDNIGAESC